MSEIKSKKLDAILKYLPKSKLKAGDGKEKGKYRFFKSGADQSKFIDIANFEGESLIIGDGGRANINFYDKKFSTSDHCYVIQKQEKSNIDMKYIYYFLKTNIHILEAGFKGAALKNISKKYISNIKIPIQSLEHQRKISSFLTQIEVLIQKRVESIKLLDELVKSTFLDMFLNNTNRDEWEVIKLENVINSIDGGWSPKCQSFSRKNNNNGVLKLSALSRDRYNDKENKEMLDETEPKINTLVKNNDLLFTRKNTYALVGSCAYVFKTEKNLFLPDLIFRLNTNSQINKIYLWKLLSSLEWKHKLKKIANGAAGSMPNISKSKLLKIDCLLPPLNLQNKFADQVVKIEQTKTIYQKSLKELENLFNATAQKYFKGELDVSKIDIQQTQKKEALKMLDKEEVLELIKQGDFDPKDHVNVKQSYDDIRDMIIGTEDEKGLLDDGLVIQRFDKNTRKIILEAK